MDQVSRREASYLNEKRTIGMWPNPRIPYQMSSDRKKLEPLNGRPLMVNPVVAIEYWPFDRPMPRGVLPAPHGRPSEPPDVANYSWVEYGMRCGLPRLFDVRDPRHDRQAPSGKHERCGNAAKRAHDPMRNVKSN